MAKRYRTIVADPPWDHSDGTGWDPADADRRRKPGAASRGEPRVTGLPYATMTVDAIRALPIEHMAEYGAHLYLWVTTRYLELAFQIVRDWGFQTSAVLAWCKPPRGWMLGGTYASNLEFVLFARRGSVDERASLIGSWLREQRQHAGLSQKKVAAHWPSSTGSLTGCVANWELGFNVPNWKQWVELKQIIGFGDEMDNEVKAVDVLKDWAGSSNTRWFTWPRGRHSEKPEAFFDLVEQVSPGPYLELFARRARFGWDYWGDESLGTAEMPEVA